MGKIITGEEFVDLVMDCYEGITNGEPDRSMVADAIGHFFNVTCEDSNKCSAYGSSTPHGQTIYLYDFWEWIYGYGLSTFGDDFYFQLADSSQYANKKLIDSTNLPVIRDHMRCTNIPFVNDIPLTSHATENNSPAPGNCEVSFEIKIGNYWHEWCNGSCAPDGSVLSLNYQNDFIIGGSENFLDDNTEYPFRVSFGFESASYREDYSYIDNLSVSLTSSYGETYIDTIFDVSPDSEVGGGFSFKASGATSLIYMKELNSIEIYGDWVGDSGSGGSGPYEFLIYDSAVVNTSSGSMAVGNVIRTQSSLATTYANLRGSNFGSTSYQVNITTLDWNNGELYLNWNGSTAPAGNYWVGFYLKYNTTYYTMYMPLTVGADGSISNGTGNYILDLGSVTTRNYNSYPTEYRSVKNNTTTAYYVWNYSSSGPQSSPVAAGGSSAYVMLLSTLYVTPTTTGPCTVKTYVENTPYTISSGVANKTVNIIPSNFNSSFGTLLTKISDKGTDFYVQLS